MILKERGEENKERRNELGQTFDLKTLWLLVVRKMTNAHAWMGAEEDNTHLCVNEAVARKEKKGKNGADACSCVDDAIMSKEGKNKDGLFGRNLEHRLVAR